jgi:hypothetical protein
MNGESECYQAKAASPIACVNFFFAPEVLSLRSNLYLLCFLFLPVYIALGVGSVTSLTIWAAPVTPKDEKGIITWTLT